MTRAIVVNLSSNVSPSLIYGLVLTAEQLQEQR